MTHPSLRRIESFWQEYRSKVYPGEFPPHQLHELRKAFFAAAYCCNSAFRAISSPAVSEEEGVEWFTDLNEDMADFEIEIKREAKKAQDAFESKLRGC